LMNIANNQKVHFESKTIIFSIEFWLTGIVFRAIFFTLFNRDWIKLLSWYNIENVGTQS
jgi:hypothetical protein